VRLDTKHAGRRTNTPTPPPPPHYILMLFSVCKTKKKRLRDHQPDDDYSINLFRANINVKE
jgi:hypothetical protein